MKVSHSTFGIQKDRIKKGLKVRAQLDTNPYPKGIKVSDDEFASIRLDRDDFHGEWNYTITPNPTKTYM